ncbi:MULTISPECIES: hypothetical protein [unclassified Thermosipho (in: thermotogales)]|nr:MULTISPECIES: hypothetical protein [unclassified Thermosipho (in: thermotogales)]
MKIKSYVSDMFNDIDKIQLFEAHNFEMNFHKYKKSSYFNDSILKD